MSITQEQINEIAVKLFDDLSDNIEEIITLLTNRVKDYRTETKSAIEEINKEIESIQKQFASIFMAYGELTGVMQVILRFILSKANDEEKKEIDKLLAQASKEFIDMLQSSGNDESSGEENNTQNTV